MEDTLPRVMSVSQAQGQEPSLSEPDRRLVKEVNFIRLEVGDVVPGIGFLEGLTVQGRTRRGQLNNQH